MTTLTSGGAVNLTSSTNWSPAQTPVAGDDLVIGAHTLTLDADMVLNTVTFNNASSRIEISGTTRTVEATNGWAINAAVGAVFCNTVIATGMEIVFGGKWSILPTSGSFSFASGTGGNLTFRTIGSVESNVVIEAQANAGYRWIASWTAGKLSTIGRIDLSQAGQPQTFITISGGEWEHRSSGYNYFPAANGRFSSITGTGQLDWTGSVDSGSIGANLGTFSLSSSSTGSVIGQAGDVFCSRGTASNAVTYLLFNSGSGTVQINGKWVSKNKSVTIYTSAGLVNYRNQAFAVAADEDFIYHGAIGTLDISGLEIANSGSVMLNECGGSVLAADANTLITNQSTAAQAASNSSALAGKIIVLESDPPTLPAVEDVAAGTVYGYAISQQTGTGLIVDPAVLASAVRAGVGMASANLDTQLAGINTNIDTITVDNAAIAAAVRTNLATELGRIDVATSTRATPADVAENAVIVSPILAQQQMRVIDSDLVGYINDTGTIGPVTITESDGTTPVNVGAWSAAARIWLEPSTGSGTRYEVTPTVTGDDGNQLLFALPAAVVADKSNWIWSLRNTTGMSAGEGIHVAGGTLNVRRAARKPA
jgi:hypothetical protein